MKLESRVPSDISQTEQDKHSTVLLTRETKEAEPMATVGSGAGNGRRWSEYTLPAVSRVSAGHLVSKEAAERGDVKCSHHGNDSKHGNYVREGRAANCTVVNSSQDVCA